MFIGLKLTTFFYLIYRVCAECNVPDIDCSLDVIVSHRDGSKVRCKDVANDDQYDYEKAPEIKYIRADVTKKYTLLMVDPDAPSRLDHRYYLHWLVNGINLCIIRTTLVGCSNKNVVTDVFHTQGGDLVNGWSIDKSGHVLIEYAQPTPPSGTHRYQFYLTEQKPGQIFVEPSIRSGFDLKKFINDNNLCSVVASYQYQVKKTQ